MSLLSFFFFLGRERYKLLLIMQEMQQTRPMESIEEKEKNDDLDGKRHGWAAGR